VSTEHWLRLSTWHNAWLAADAQTRERLRAELGVQHPELAAQADALVAASAGLPGFLETPALALAAGDLAADDPVFAVDALIGPYRIVGLLARGGMGDVYRATDVRLRRDVALKVVAHGTADTQRVERFLQEARITAALDHPNIVKVFDVGVADGRPYLVAELLDGETLRARLGRGRLAVEDARRIAGEVAAGLTAAHVAGLVHRDLKPDNVFLTRSGVTKILDFGVAKASDGPALGGGLATLTGVLLGTASYLAPEQVRGDAVDGRTDLFALGSMLFEMLTGERAFAREHTVDTLHAILHEAPPDRLVPARVPAEFAAIVMRLLEKDAARRFQSAADLEWALHHIARPHEWSSAPAEVVSRRPVNGLPQGKAWLRRAAPSAAAAAAIGLVAFGLTAWYRSDAPEVPRTATRFQVPPPGGTRFVNDVERTHLALSPDGSQLAFIADTFDNEGRRIWVRPMSGVEARPLSGTEGAYSLFWSPDGRSLAFFAGDKLKRLDLPDGAAVPLCDVPEGLGLTGTWGADGEILFGSVRGDEIVGVSARTGRPAAVLARDPARGEVRVNYPWFLPDGRRFLYSSRLRDGSGRVMLGERGRPSRPLLSAVSNAQWVDPDIVVFARDGILLGQRVDLTAAEIVGEAFSIGEPIDYFYSTARAEFTTSTTGSVAYQSHTDTARLVWSDRSGTRLGDVGAPGNYLTVRLAPDGNSVLFDRGRKGPGTQDLWILDLRRGGETRLTADMTSEVYPIWLADGRGIVFTADRDGPPHLFRKDLETGKEEQLLPAGQLQQPDDVTPDGRTLAFRQRTPRGTYDILTLELDRPGSSKVVVGSAFDEVGLRFSPDGRAAAFLSNETGRYEVYVAAFPAMTPKLRVSAAGGRAPRWNPAGSELLYLTPDGRLVAVPVGTAPSLQLGTPITLFAVPERAAWSDFAVSGDGRRFFAISFESRGSEQPITVVLNGFGEGARR
jgi:Tol biopolymer transport system component